MSNKKYLFDNHNIRPSMDQIFTNPNYQSSPTSWNIYAGIPPCSDYYHQSSRSGPRTPRGAAAVAAVQGAVGADRTYKSTCRLTRSAAYRRAVLAPPIPCGCPRARRSGGCGIWPLLVEP